MRIVDEKFQQLKIGIIGLGNVGLALGKGLRLAGHQSRTIGCDRNLEKRERFTHSTDIATTENWREVVEFADLILVCVRHAQVLPFLEQLRDSGHTDKGVVSLAAVVSSAALKQALSPAKIPAIRVITNVNVASRDGMTMVLTNPEAPEVSDSVVALFRGLGAVIVTDSERDLDRASVLTGCGPAVTAILLEAFTSFGLKTGLSEQVAKEVALQIVAASVQNISLSAVDLREFKYSVAAPGGIVDKLLGSSESTQVNDAILHWLDFVLKKIEGRD